MICSAGRWRAIKAAYEAGLQRARDERTLGGSSFDERTLAGAGKGSDRGMRLKASGINLDENIIQIATAAVYKA